MEHKPVQWSTYYALNGWLGFDSSLVPCFFFAGRRLRFLVVIGSRLTLASLNGVESAVSPNADTAEEAPSVTADRPGGSSLPSSEFICLQSKLSVIIELHTVRTQ
jgi:hypothetical protein